MDRRIVCCETEQAMNSEQSSEIVFNNGYAATVMNTRGMMAQIPTQQPTVSNHHPLEHFVTDTPNDCQDNMLVLASTHIYSVVLPATNTANYSIYPYFSFAVKVSVLATSKSSTFSVSSYVAMYFENNVT